jgi:hypothetical protein
MRRGYLVAGALASLSLAGATAAAGQELTDANSIVVPGALDSAQGFEGQNCGGTATRTKPLPSDAEDIVVTGPKVGDRDPAGGTRVTAVSLTGTVMSVSVVADGPTLCDPSRPTVEWRANYTFTATFTQREQATIRVYFDSSLKGARWDLEATTIRNGRAGAFKERFTAIRWQRFGGLTAVGTGKLRQDRCRGSCPLDGKRVRVTASDPALCEASDRIEYRRLVVTLGGRTRFSRRLSC